jgi:hypothetical protein
MLERTDATKYEVLEPITFVLAYRTVFASNIFTVFPFLVTHFTPFFLNLFLFTFCLPFLSFPPSITHFIIPNDTYFLLFLPFPPSFLLSRSPSQVTEPISVVPRGQDVFQTVRPSSHDAPTFRGVCTCSPSCE